ncbi:hypothetical protein K432DRAFT_349764 [Lepidopterella palustris CBS 459.81]|uniref:Thioesterase domain-containing protein n=1 Tax=Lepidopterella palustris CBS 459.81 TaxID=1314670 RepID=A0A8E2EDN2_9PEZI|nr:hypothetical protein K432DRAFT_349764 [Lepidopterella palustris CBS 459.81]
MTSFSDSKALSYFESIPWCATYLQNPSYIYLKHLPPRIPATTSTSHNLLLKTFNTPSTIPAVLSLYKKPPKGEHITETLAFIALGPDINGHADTAHGGIVATILDECAGLIQRLSAPIEGQESRPVFTAGLDVRFLRPVRTPQVILVRSKMLGAEGRKKRVSVSMEDEWGVPLAEAGVVFVRSRSDVRL